VAEILEFYTRHICDLDLAPKWRGPSKLKKHGYLSLGRTFDHGNKKTSIYGPPICAGTLYYDCLVNMHGKNDYTDRYFFLQLCLRFLLRN